SRRFAARLSQSRRTIAARARVAMRTEARRARFSVDSPQPTVYSDKNAVQKAGTSRDTRLPRRMRHDDLRRLRQVRALYDCEARRDCEAHRLARNGGRRRQTVEV